MEKKRERGIVKGDLEILEARGIYSSTMARVHSILGFLAPLKKKKLVKPKKGKKNETAITPSFRKCISALGAGPHCEMCMVIVSKGIQNLPDWQGPPLSREAREWKKGGEGIRFIFAFICCC